MIMIEAYKKFLQNYTVFTGRSRRADYWWACLANMIITAVLSVITTILPVLSFLSGIYGLAILIPDIAIVVRRLHDIGKSGWYCLIALIPLVGSIILLIWLATDSQPGPNAYGENPKGM